MEEVTCQKLDGRKAWEQGCVWLVDKLVGIISKSPSPHNQHPLSHTVSIDYTRVLNAVTLVWGSLKLAPTIWMTGLQIGQRFEIQL